MEMHNQENVQSETDNFALLIENFRLKITQKTNISHEEM